MIASNVIRRQTNDAVHNILHTSINMESLVRVHAAANISCAVKTIFKPGVIWSSGISYCLYEFTVGGQVEAETYRMAYPKELCIA